MGLVEDKLQGHEDRCVIWDMLTFSKCKALHSAMYFCIEREIYVFSKISSIVYIYLRFGNKVPDALPFTATPFRRLDTATETPGICKKRHERDLHARALKYSLGL